MRRTVFHSDRRVRLLVLLIIPGMLAVMAVALGAAFFLVPFSMQMALCYPELAHMRLPVLAALETLLLLFLTACALSILLLARVYRASLFTRSSARLLRFMGLCFFLMIPLLAGLIAYTLAHVDGSITNLYALMGAGLAFVAGCLLLLFSHLVFQGAQYKQDVELTV